MTDKELQRLSRKDLIEILYYLSRENDELREENTQLRGKLDALVSEALAAKQQPAVTQAVQQTAPRKRKKK